MSRRLPIVTVKYATDSFNWIRRLNDRVRVARLNRDGRKFSNYLDKQGVDWYPEREAIVPTEKNKPCYPPMVAIRKIKVWLLKVNMRVNYGLKCRKCIIESLTPKPLTV